MPSPFSTHHPWFHYRLVLLLSLVVLVPVGYLIRFRGPAPEWVKDSVGSIAYEVFWVALVLFLYPRLSVMRVAIAIFLITCSLEVLQLWQAPWWLTIRATVPGRLVFGNTFSWSDFPAYAIGSLVGWGWVQSLRSSQGGITS